jgi:hypothetical protein
MTIRVLIADDCRIVPVGLSAVLGEIPEFVCDRHADQRQAGDSLPGLVVN